MIYGIGHDLVANYRIENLFDQYGQKLVNKLLTKHEQLLYVNCKTKTKFLAKRFAAKEAFSKACGTGLCFPILLKNISILNNSMGKPVFYFEKELQKWLDKQSITQYHVSLTDEIDYSSAFVILESI
ncbi:MAG: holo-ACP synthase [Neisseriaceae bacterium]